MPQSLSVAYMHLVFSTKNRVPLLENRDLRIKTHAYLAGTSTKHDCPAIIVNGMADHVHILARFGREITQSRWVRELKRASSLWIKTKSPEASDFAWQSGYGLFSVSQSNLDTVRNYVEQQEEHHKKISFQDEFRKLLERHGIEYDERYVWD